MQGSDVEKSQDLEKLLFDEYHSSHPDEEKIKLLLAKGANVNAQDKDGATLLHWAIKAKHVDVVNKLIGQGADINKEDNNGETPLDLVMQSLSPNIQAIFSEKSREILGPTPSTASRIASGLIALGYALIAGPFLGRTKISLEKPKYAWESPVGFLVNTYNSMPTIPFFTPPVRAFVALAATTLASPFLVALIPVNMVLALVEQSRYNSFEKAVKGFFKSKSRSRSHSASTDVKKLDAQNSRKNSDTQIGGVFMPKSLKEYCEQSDDTPRQHAATSQYDKHRSRNKEKRGSKERGKEEEEEEEKKRNSDPGLH